MTAAIICFLLLFKHIVCHGTSTVSLTIVSVVRRMLYRSRGISFEYIWSHCPMKKLTNTQKQYLRRMAHELRPVVQIGKNGLTDQVHTTVDQELNAHELIKVKFVDFKDEKK